MASPGDSPIRLTGSPGLPAATDSHTARLPLHHPVTPARERRTTNQSAYAAQPKVLAHPNTKKTFHQNEGFSVEKAAAAGDAAGADSRFSKYSKSASWVGVSRDLSNALIRPSRLDSPGRRSPFRCLSSVTSWVKAASYSSSAKPGGGGNLNLPAASSKYGRSRTRGCLTGSSASHGRESTPCASHLAAGDRLPQRTRHRRQQNEKMHVHSHAPRSSCRTDWTPARTVFVGRWAHPPVPALH